MTDHEPLAAQLTRAVSDAVTEAIDTRIRPVLSRHIGQVLPDITWRLITVDDSTWSLDDLGPARVNAQIDMHDYDQIRAFIELIARTFGGEHIRDVSPPFPDREVRNVETTVNIEGVPVTVWGTTDL